MHPIVGRYSAELAAAQTHAAAGDIDALATALLVVATGSGVHLQYADAEVVTALARLDDARRAELVDRFTAEADATGVRSHGVDVIQYIVGRVAVADASRATAYALLNFAARHQIYYWSAEHLARLATTAGGRLTGEHLAVLRRTAVAVRRDGTELATLVAALREPPFNPGEPWADRANADLAHLGPDWPALAGHALTATAAKPTEAWARRGRARLDTVGPHAAAARIRDWLALVGLPRTHPLDRGEYESDVNAQYDPYNANALRGLAWLLADTPAHPDTPRALAALVETSLRHVPGTGPRNPKVANAGVVALSRIDGEAALAQIARLAARVTYKGTLNELNAALDRRATALGLSRDEVEELAVPSYGLTGTGQRRTPVGGTTAELTINGTKTTLTWYNAAGKPLRSAPAADRAAHRDQLADLKAAARDIDKMLTAQTERLDRQFLARRTWTGAAWRERLADHPLVGTIARRLIWTVDGEAYAYHDDRPHRLDGTPVTVADDAVVALWHPIDRPADEIAGWRARLEQHTVTQPFKQAHREVYVLTDAERRTGDYSNRYAGHVLRQHQYHALAAIRGWRDPLRLAVDDVYPPTSRELPRWALRAEFWVEGIGDDPAADLAESGSFLRLTTDQVRFYPIDAPWNLAHAHGGPYTRDGRYDAGPVESLPLADVPPLVLSEIMRDIDLFVGVASVGNDPTWTDGGPAGRFRDYWTAYSLAPLSQTAETRRDLLTRILPRLALAPRATIDGRFLVIRGDLRTYRIHLGSTNVLMSPNDTYLCIVPKRIDDATPFLPFDGDRVLAMILSKAVLLANDSAITDPSITSQIRL